MDMVCRGGVWSTHGVLLHGMAVSFLGIFGQWSVVATDGKNDQLVTMDDITIDSRLYISMAIVEKCRTY